MSVARPVLVLGRIRMSVARTLRALRVNMGGLYARLGAALGNNRARNGMATLFALAGALVARVTRRALGIGVGEWLHGAGVGQSQRSLLRWHSYFLSIFHGWAPRMSWSRATYARCLRHILSMCRRRTGMWSSHGSRAK